MTDSDRQPPPQPPSVPPPSDPPSPRPWRTEGVPSAPPAKARQRWARWGLWPLGYVILFAMFTYQDRMSEPEAVSYTAVKTEVANKNVKEIFARGDALWPLDESLRCRRPRLDYKAFARPRPACL